jgi:hypothetical protein
MTNTLYLARVHTLASQAGPPICIDAAKKSRPDRLQPWADHESCVPALATATSPCLESRHPVAARACRGIGIEPPETEPGMLLTFR